MTQFKENYAENYTALINNLRLAMSIADSMKHESYILVIINGSDEYVKGFHILENLHGLYFSLYEDIYLGILRENPDNYTLYRIQAYFLYLDFWDKIHNQMNILDQLYTIASNSKVNQLELEVYYIILEKYLENIQNYAYLKAYGHLPTTTISVSTTTLP